jgi:hypothetical protein
VQVTNSALDPDTLAFEPSRLIIRKEIVEAGAVVADDNFDQDGQIVLSAGTSQQVCGDWRSDTQTCLGPLATDTLRNVISRPAGTPTVFLKKDGSGFQIMTLWYAYSPSGCNKGSSHFTIHEVKLSGPVGVTVEQVYGKQISGASEEPVRTTTVVGGKLVFSVQGTSDSGPAIEPVAAAAIDIVPGTTSGGGSGTIHGGKQRFGIFGWVETSGM